MADKSNLRRIADFVLSIGSEIIRANSNTPPYTWGKTLFINLVRRKVPDSLKQFILASGIKPEEDSESIKALTAIIKKYPHKSSTKEEDQYQPKEYIENKIKNAMYYSVGNCAESAQTCAGIWMECTKEILEFFNLPSFPAESAPYIEYVRYKKDETRKVEDHCFNIVNLPSDADLSNINEWVKNDNEVIIIDLWKRNFESISVNEQLALPKDQRCLSFQTLCDNLEKGDQLEVMFRARLGEGHSNRWLEKGRSQYHFIEHKYPNLIAMKRSAFHETFFGLKPKKREEKESHRAHPYRRG